MKMLYLLFIVLIVGCELPDIPEPTPTPTPLLPIPTSPPIRFGIYAPHSIPIQTPVVIVFCGKTFATDVYADDYRLGYLAHNNKSGCHQLIQPGFNTPGKRTLKIGNLEHVIDVFKAP